MIKLAILSLVVLVGCVHDAPVAAPSPQMAAAVAQVKAALDAPPNRAIQVVTLANKDVQCADLRRPGDVADSALCMMPGGAFVWLSVSAAALEIRVVADPPKKPDEAKPASSPAEVKGASTSAKPAAKGKL